MVSGLWKISSVLFARTVKRRERRAPGSAGFSPLQRPEGEVLENSSGSRWSRSSGVNAAPRERGLQPASPHAHQHAQRFPTPSPIHTLKRRKRRAPGSRSSGVNAAPRNTKNPAGEPAGLMKTQLNLFPAAEQEHRSTTESGERHRAGFRNRRQTEVGKSIENRGRSRRILGNVRSTQ